MKVKIFLDSKRTIGEISDVFFGSFVEHMGRCVYGGIYDEGSQLSDESGFRKDVSEKVKNLHLDIVRYPGGNFVSGYDWKNGIGSISKRPEVLDLAWMQLEPNKVGVLEFYRWAKKNVKQIMMAVNLGTGTAKDAQELVEYCNANKGYWAEQRKKDGQKDPLNIRYWCLGNEMDGPWQICTHLPDEYGRKAVEAAKLMKWVDPEIKLVACGSSGSLMYSYPYWDRQVLEHLYDYVDCISLHRYYTNNEGTTLDYLASFQEFDQYIRGMIAVCDYVKALKRSKKVMKLSFDEWNVQDRTDYVGETHEEKWTVGARRGESKYNFLDGLVVAQLLSVLVNHADRIEITCQAQLVNVLGLIFSEKEGSYCQTIYYPFALASQYLRGVVLDAFVESPCFESKMYGLAPYIQISASKNEAEHQIVLYTINASLNEEAEVTFAFDHFPVLKCKKIIFYQNESLNTMNQLGENNVGVREICCDETIENEFNYTIPKHTLAVMVFEYEDNK